MQVRAFFCVLFIFLFGLVVFNLRNGLRGPALDEVRHGIRSITDFESKNMMLYILYTMAWILGAERMGLRFPGTATISAIYAIMIASEVSPAETVIQQLFLMIMYAIIVTIQRSWEHKEREDYLRLGAKTFQIERYFVSEAVYESRTSKV